MEDIEELHRAACSAGRDTYKDPTTGYTCFTEACHRRRGYCCGNGCRHCPYGHFNVSAAKQKGAPAAITSPVLIAADKKKRAPAGRTRVLFWSGGKDSFQTLRRLEEGGGAGGGTDVTLLTTFNAATGSVAFQNTHIQDIMAQAKALGRDLLAVPLEGGGEPTPRGNYEDAVQGALEGLLGGRVEALVFGDLHLQDIRAWREEAFGGRWACEFPLFGTPYSELLPRLWAEERVSIAVTAVEEGVGARHGDIVKEGAEYNAAFVDKVAATTSLDVMGENGEFHTHVTFL